MASLLFEYWEDEDGGSFFVVHEHNDRVQPRMEPNARFMFSLRASSWHEAMQMYNDRLGYGEYQSAGVENVVFTDEEQAEQDAYLAVRQSR
ncbi:MAG: hypothetical protein ACO1O3_13235 [Sphingobium sp.]